MLERLKTMVDPESCKVWGLIVLLMLCGCASQSQRSEVRGQRSEFAALMPPAPSVPPAKDWESEHLHFTDGKSFGGRVTLAWENEAVGMPVNWKTGIEATTNLVDWRLVWIGPYAVSNQVTLTNQPAGRCFYRAYNSY
jgi:hypothetical protein